MFNLEKAISTWRQEMAAKGIKAALVLDELESHLRDEIEKRIHSGADEQKAFSGAVVDLGEASVLKAEFAKLGRNKGNGRFLNSCYIAFAACSLLINTWTLLEYELSTLERITGFAAVSLISLYVAFLPKLLKALSPTTQVWVAKVLKPAGFLLCLWPMWALLEAEHIVSSGFGILPMVLLWSLFGALAMTVCAVDWNSTHPPPGGHDGLLPFGQTNPLPIPPWPTLPPEFRVSLPPSKPIDPDVRDSLRAACEEANRLGHDFVGTEHVLLGLLQLAKGSFAHILQRMNLDPEAVREEVERSVFPTLPHEARNPLPFTPRALKAVKLAGREAKSLNQTSISAELVFLGLMLEGGGVAAMVLRKLGIHPEKAREEILKLKEIRPGRFC